MLPTTQVNCSRARIPAKRIRNSIAFGRYRAAAEIAAPGFSAQEALSAVQAMNAISSNRKPGWLKMRSRRSRSPAVTIASHDSTVTRPAQLTDSVPWASGGRTASRKVPICEQADARRKVGHRDHEEQQRDRHVPDAIGRLKPASTPTTKARLSRTAASSPSGQLCACRHGRAQRSAEEVGFWT